MARGRDLDVVLRDFHVGEGIGAKLFAERDALSDRDCCAFAIRDGAIGEPLWVWCDTRTTVVALSACSASRIAKLATQTGTPAATSSCLDSARSPSSLSAYDAPVMPMFFIG